MNDLTSIIMIAPLPWYPQTQMEVVIEQMGLDVVETDSIPPPLDVTRYNRFSTIDHYAHHNCKEDQISLGPPNFQDPQQSDFACSLITLIITLLWLLPPCLYRMSSPIEVSSGNCSLMPILVLSDSSPIRFSGAIPFPQALLVLSELSPIQFLAMFHPKSSSCNIPG